MNINPAQISSHNESQLPDHKEKFDFLANQLTRSNIDVDSLIKKVQNLQIEVPSWALGTGGTRFGRFAGGGEPGNLIQKIEDVGVLNTLSRACDSISLHIPWDIPSDANAIKQELKTKGLTINSVNSNTFQDQPGQKKSYKFGSLCHTDKGVRKQAVDHNIEVIEYGKMLDANVLTVWLADGSSFPGQMDFRTAYSNTLSSLEDIYDKIPSGWQMLLEYKPFEPAFYHTVIPDWGTSYSMVTALGNKANTLVDLGHHLPNTNIEQIVATLQLLNKLGGFHFNDSKYADDDISVGSIKPYALFLIFLELVKGEQTNMEPAWMIDASHNLKDPLEDLLQSLQNIHLNYAKALTVDLNELKDTQESNEVAQCQEILQNAFQLDLRPLVAEARLRAGGALHPLSAFKDLKVRENLIRERGTSTVATGL
ncbi:MAG: sugar isomerase [Cyclobacteriaceae bacterium]|nr:sugar isomerase [Cyclobacteriaceae bacterium SS2]